MTTPALKLHLVLLPGMDGTGGMFDGFITALSGACVVHVVRYPAQAALGYHDLARIARSFIPSDQPWVILGESFSGPVAISLAAEAANQPHCRGLILCASFARNPRPQLGWLRPLVGMTPVSILPPDALSPILFGRWSTPALRAQLRHALAQVAPQALQSRLRAVMEVDVSNRLCQITVPILYLQASHDRLVPASSGDLIKRLRPKTEMVKLEGPHLLLQVAPQECARVILDSLKD